MSELVAQRDQVGPLKAVIMIVKIRNFYDTEGNVQA